MLLLQFILIQTILFGAVIFFLRKIMMGSTESAVSRLNESYVQMNQKKEELAQKIQQAQQDYESRKKEAERVADKIKNDADQEARDKKDALLKKAHEEAERIIVDTVSAKEKIREDILKEERIKLIEYCRDLVSGVYDEVVGEKIDRILISEFLDEVSEMSADNLPAGTEDIEIISRNKLDESDVKRISEIVKSKISGNVKIKQTVSGDLLGGLVIKFGNLVLDGSIAGKLKDKANLMQEKIHKGH
jgi:F0F1-type ATP synthase delta subunit